MAARSPVSYKDAGFFITIGIIYIMKSGDLLYKYRPFNDDNFKHVEDLFTKNQIYFPSPNTFNDPFDCRVNLSFALTDYRWRKYFIRALKKNRPDLSSSERSLEAQRILNAGAYKTLEPSLIKGITDKLGVYCLSAVNDNLLMWSHYAEKHTGFVLEFRAGPTDTFFRRAQLVQYKSDYPMVSVADSDEDRTTAVMLTKSIDWKYECEYRIIEYHNGPGIYTFPEHLLTGVIIGCEMSEERKTQIQQLISRRNVKPVLYEARKKSLEFGLSFEVLS